MTVICILVLLFFILLIFPCKCVFVWNKKKTYHGVCRVNYLNKAGRIDMAMKEKLRKKLKEIL